MENKITNQIKTLFAGVDERNWGVVEATMAESVLLDYSSFSGNPATQLTPVQITESWAAFLPGFDRTHHHLSNFRLIIEKDLATVTFDGKADHVMDDEVWTVTGNYHIALKHRDDRWFITSFTFHFEEQSGNPDLPAMAIEKMLKS